MDNVIAKPDPVNGRSRCVRNLIVPIGGCAPKVLHEGFDERRFRREQRACRGRSSFFRWPSVAQAEPERLGHDAENPGVLPANTVASGANRGFRSTFARPPVEGGGYFAKSRGEVR
jgi:hypothetical protein